MAYDVIIVGARVAGSSLALLLGRQGRRVLLVDRDHFPSDTLSTHLMSAAAVGRLDQLGVLQEVEASGLRRIRRMRTYVDDCVLEGPVAGQPPYTYWLAPRRDRLDSILIDHACRHPSVEFRERTTVEGLLWENGRVVGVGLRSPRDGHEDVRATVVVGADGRNSHVAEWVQAPVQQHVPALRPGYYAYYHGVEALPEPAVELFHQDGHIGFLFPMEPGVDCLVVELQPEDFETYRNDLDAQFERRMRRFPGLARRLEGGTRDGPIYGTRGIENYMRAAYGPGWVLTGDAAYLKDPCTGYGIGDALLQAFMLAEALGAALNGADWDSTFGQYQQRRNETFLPLFRATIAAARHPGVSNEALAWLRATLVSPFWVEALTANWPAVLAAPGVFPAAALPGVAMWARIFGAKAELPRPAAG